MQEALVRESKNNSGNAGGRRSTMPKAPVLVGKDSNKNKSD